MLSLRHIHGQAQQRAAPLHLAVSEMHPVLLCPQLLMLCKQSLHLQVFVYFLWRSGIPRLGFLSNPKRR
jgi:hypothetical protein